MIVGIHQPNFLPGLSFFTKILCSDVFIFLDSVQFTKGNWINRNRLKSHHGEIMLTVPVITSGKLYQPILEVRIANNQKWQQKHYKTIKQYYSKSPFFSEFADLLAEIYNQPWDLLAEMNIYIIKKICNRLKMDKIFYRSSQLCGADLSSTDLLVYLTKSVGGDTYLSGVGGKKYMALEKFPKNNLKLLFLNFTPVNYTQQFKDFIPNLSILDLLYNEGPNSLNVLKNSVKVES